MEVMSYKKKVVNQSGIESFEYNPCLVEVGSRCHGVKKHCYHQFEI
jgi:hypothetical protein